MPNDKKLEKSDDEDDSMVSQTATDAYPNDDNDKNNYDQPSHQITGVNENNQITGVNKNDDKNENDGKYSTSSR